VITKIAPKNQILSVALRIALILFVYIFLPVYLGARFFRPQLKFTVLFYLTSAAILIYLANKYSRAKFRLYYQSGELQEKINILRDEKSKEEDARASLKEKISRYNGLKNIIEEINRNLDLDFAAERLCRIAHSVIGKGGGTCLLSLLDEQAQRLSLFKAQKEDPGLAIKAKQGDIFDFWVMRHACALLVEDIRKDFRFDLERIPSDASRPVSSLIATPLISEQRFLGILRLDSPKVGAYSQDDLRFLVALAELGAVALENSELFKKTQDLVIHDGLTGLFTKGYFLERLNEECFRALRQGNSFCLVMLDIDFFKQYNDKFGHTAGDLVLKKISQDMRESCAGLNALACRFGGEEFCLFLHGIDKKEAVKFTEALLQRIEKEKIILRREASAVTVSAGVAAFPADADSVEELIRKADRAMYAAKQKGRNRVCPI
jgi:diguanylate cyclase (GGDEF)-like protein